MVRAAPAREKLTELTGKLGWLLHRLTGTPGARETEWAQRRSGHSPEASHNPRDRRASIPHVTSSYNVHKRPIFAFEKTVDLTTFIF